MQSKHRNAKNKLVLILHDIRSAQNVGSILRTADTAGVAVVVFTGYTPAPIDRFGRPRRDIAKAALGAQASVPWSQEKSIFEVLKHYRGEGFGTIAVEQHKQSYDYRTLKKGRNQVFIFGNEVTGLPEAVVSACDKVVEIPLLGKKESLNVAVAVGIVLFSILRRAV